MKVIGLARLGRDAEVRTTQGGEQVASLSLAFTRRVKGEKLTDWVDGALWGKRAEALAQYLTKGSLVVVTLDDVHIETYQGKNGEGNKLVGRVTDVELAGGGGERAAAPAPRQAAAAPNLAGRQQRNDAFDDGSDVPF
jgi:single-strand DNA-binding protein